MEQFERTDEGFFHKGYFGRIDYFVPLPMLLKFERMYNPNDEGSWQEVISYMYFCIREVSPLSLDHKQIVLGEEIAKYFCEEANTNLTEEFEKLKLYYKIDNVTWNSIFDTLIKNELSKYVKDLTRNIKGF